MKYLVWSNQKGMWWRADRRGYASHIEEAGRYERAEAEAIVADATCDGQLAVRRENPVTGEWYSQLSEVMVLAPEAIASQHQPLVTDHLWRPPKDSNRNHLDRPCAFMNCGRPVEEHERAVSGARSRWGQP